MDAQRIGSNMRALRGEATIEQTAAQIGVSKSALAMYERGKRIPRDEIKVRIARFYKRSVQDIFFA